MFKRNSAQAPSADLEDFEVWRSKRAFAIQQREKKRLIKTRAEADFGNSDGLKFLPEASQAAEVSSTPQKYMTSQRQPMKEFRFAALLVLPLAVVATYLGFFATPLYQAQVQFFVHADVGNSELESSSSLLENQILHSFIESVAFTESLKAESEIPTLLTSETIDPVQRIWTHSLFPISEKKQMKRFIFSHFDRHTGLISLYTRAPSTALANELSNDAVEVLSDHLERQANLLDLQIRDSNQYKFGLAEEQLRNAEIALTNFRVENNVFNPEAVIEASLNNSRSIASQIREIEHELAHLREVGREQTQQYLQLENLRDSLQAQATTENTRLISSQIEPGVLNEYQTLSTRRDLARSNYSAAYDQILRTPKNIASIRIVSPTQVSQKAVSPNVFGSLLLALIFFSTVFLFTNFVFSKRDY